MAALGGAPGPTRDSLIYGGALCLWHVRNKDSLAGGAQAVRAALDGGAALEHLRRMR